MSALSDLDIEAKLNEIRQFQVENRRVLPEHMTFLKAHWLAIDAFYRRKYWDYFDLLPRKIRTVIDEGLMAADPESMTNLRNYVPTIRQAFEAVGFKLDAWCKKHGIDQTDDVLDLVKTTGK